MSAAASADDSKGATTGAFEETTADLSEAATKAQNTDFLVDFILCILALCCEGVRHLFFE